MKDDVLNRFRKFLDDNHPGYEKCMVCKEEKEITHFDGEVKKETKYYLVEKHRGNGCDLYIINSHMWWDWGFCWKDVDCPWEVIFKSE